MATLLAKSANTTTTTMSQGEDFDRLLDDLPAGVRRAVLRALDDDEPESQPVATEAPRRNVSRSKSITAFMYIVLYVLLVIRFSAKLLYSSCNYLVLALSRQLDIMSPTTTRKD